jgi:predicted outer membrane repeat protein
VKRGAGKISRLAVVAVATVLLGVLGPATARSQTAGVDCGCTRTGPYVDPAKGKNLNVSIEGASPHDVYEVTATTGGADGRALITVRRASDDVIVLRDIQATNWGFSPDDQRFVYHYLLNGQHFVFLYDLSQTPAKKLWESAAIPTSDRIEFSPSGRSFLYSHVTVSPTGISTSNLELIDAETGVTKHHHSFIIRSAPGYDDATLGAATWGFSPGDGRFVYSYLTSESQAIWRLVNLETGTVVRDETIGGTGFWRFSPCGDVIGLVEQPNQTQVTVLLFETSTGLKISPPGLETSVLGAVELSTDATRHLVNVGGTTQYTVPNTAGEACSVDPPVENDPPVAMFTAPAALKAGVEASFTDTSTDTDGTIETWSWAFGDDAVSSEQHPKHVYAAAGTYTVTLVVTDDDEATDDVSKQVTVTPNEPPAASFTASPASPQRGDLVTFTDTSTDDDAISSRSWRIGDEFFFEPVVEYKACESFDVELTVYDGVGQSDMATASYVISETGETIFVPAGGSLADAVAAACPGDSIQLAAGTHTGGVILDRVNLSGAGAGLTIVSGSGEEPAGWVLETRGEGDPAVTISDLTVRGGGIGEAHGGGGILAGTRGLTRLLDLEVASNQGSGGIYVDCCDADLELRDSYVHHNTSNGPNPGGGVGMFCCGSVTIADSEIAFNSAPDSDGAGAAPYEADTVVFVGNDVHDNSAAGEGGGLLLDSFGSGDTVVGNRFTGNSAEAGGAIAAGGDVLLAGNLVVDNSGGGVLRSGHGGSFQVINSTVADNGGPGIADELDWASPTALFNTIVTGNTVDVVGGLGSTGNNLIGAAAGFVGGGNYHLAAGSAAIDAGDNSQVPLALTKDVDGDDRIADGDGDGTATVDVGYDETAASAIDSTPPNVTATPERGSDHGGWYSAPVTITFTGTDAGSGVASCDPAVTYSGPDGASASVIGTCIDNAGNVGTATFELQYDATAPVVAAPADVSVGTDAGTCVGTAIALGLPTATDNISGAAISGTRGDGWPLGEAYPLGTTTITWTAVDAAGNETSAVQDVTVEDRETPIVHAPADVTGVDVLVDPGTATASDNCPGIGSVSGERSDAKALAAPYPVGTTTIVWKVFDAAGNEGSATQTVTVRDVEPPSITIPSSLVVNATSPAGAVVAFTVSATDAVDPSPLVTCSPASGSRFPIGLTTVQCTATDQAGNSAQASFTVTVKGAAQQILDLIDKTLAFMDQPQLEATLKARLEAVVAALVANRPTVVCRLLNDYSFAVRGAPPRAGLTRAEKDELVADATRIKTVVACP